jgi:hypothetical protein
VAAAAAGALHAPSCAQGRVRALLGQARRGDLGWGWLGPRLRAGPRGRRVRAGGGVCAVRWAAAVRLGWAVARAGPRGSVGAVGRAGGGKERGKGGWRGGPAGPGKGAGLKFISLFLSLFYLFQFDIMRKQMIR